MQKGFTSLLLLGIVAVLILGAFFAGMKYSENRREVADKISKQNFTPIVQKVSVEEDLEERCGDIPEEAYPKGDPNWTTIAGPYWSPDCRYTASSVTVTGRGLPPNMNAEIFKKGLNVPVGVHLYNDARKTLNLIYKSKTEDDAIFKKWVNSQSFIFSVGNQKYEYIILTKEITPTE